jgi:hypothetical protein
VKCSYGNGMEIVYYFGVNGLEILREESLAGAVFARKKIYNNINKLRNGPIGFSRNLVALTSQLILEN